VYRPFRTAHKQRFDGSPASQSTPVLDRLRRLQVRISRNSRGRIRARRLRRSMSWTDSLRRIIQILNRILPTQVAGRIGTDGLVLLLRSSGSAFAVQ
jgi:uncharacterized NAD(P)/FAD-binding protein YdhS